MVQVRLSFLEAFEAQALQRRSLGMADPTLHFPLSIRMPDATRQGHGAVMLKHIAVQRVERGVVDVGGEHALAQIIQHNNAGAATQPAESLLMQFGPNLRAGPEHQQPNGLATVTESQHEQPRAAVLADVRVAHHRAGAVVDLKFFAGCSFDDCACFRRLASTKLPNETVDALILGGEAAGIHQFLPDRHGVAAM